MSPAFLETVVFFGQRDEILQALVKLGRRLSVQNRGVYNRKYLHRNMYQQVTCQTKHNFFSNISVNNSMIYIINIKVDYTT